MIYTKKLNNSWTVSINETKDFKGIITENLVVLFSDKEIDVYGIFQISSDEIKKIHGFYNLRYIIDIENKTIDFSFTEK